MANMVVDVQDTRDGESMAEAEARVVAASKVAASTPANDLTYVPDETVVAAPPGTPAARPDEVGAEYLKLSRIRASVSQPRKRFKKIAELAANIRALAADNSGDGLIHAILVRPSGNDYELVDGERRLQALEMNRKSHGGVDWARVVIRVLSDREADEIRLAANLQRDDLNAIEEAEAFDRLVRVHGATKDQIAERFGMSKRTVYARLQLMNLCPEGRKALDEEQIKPSVAALIAQRPTHKFQARMIARLLERGITTHEAAAELFREEFSYELRRAPFDPKDEFLDPAAGPCSKCPHNARNQQQLDLVERRSRVSASVSTHPDCFNGKVAEHLKLQRQKAEEQGKTWLGKEEAKKVFHGADDVPASSEYVDLDAPCYALPAGRKQKNWRDILDKDEMPPLFAAASPRGHVHVLARKEDAVAAAKKRGTLGEKQAEVAGRNKKVEMEELCEEDDLQSAIAGKVLAAGIVEAKKGFTPVLLRLMIVPLLEGCPFKEELEQRRGRSVAHLIEDLPKLKEPDLRGLLFELALGARAADVADPVVVAMLKLLKLDRRALEREAKKEMDLAAAEELMGKGKKKKKASGA